MRLRSPRRFRQAGAASLRNRDVRDRRALQSAREAVLHAGDGFDPGSSFKHFRIERQIGRGAFGVVYLARDTLVNRPVALKILAFPQEGEAERERALAEARLVGGLKSPHIVTLHGVHPSPRGGWVFEMEYLDGGTVEDLLVPGEPLPPERTATILIALLLGLHAAHERHVLHGDVKPGNVLLGRNGDVKLADFGLASLLTEATINRSFKGEVVGTPSYIAPEVIMGERPTAASDVWSAGVILYRMITGRHPFHGGSLPDLFYGIQNSNPPAPGPEAPPTLARIALRCLAKRPGDRPASCAEILSLLGHASARVAVPPAPPSPAPALLGRARELERLDALLSRVEGGHGAALLITGEAGIGKTALLQAFARRASQRGFLWIEALVTPVEGLLRPLVRGVQGAPVTHGLSGAPPPARMLLDKEAHGIRLENKAHAVLAIEQLLDALAAGRPVALAVEDAHDASVEEFRLLCDLARRLAPKRVLLAVTWCVGEAVGSGAGSADPSELSSIEGVERMELGPLPPETLYGILEEAIEGARLDPDVAERITSLASGNPRFARELFRHLEESGAIVRGKLRARGGLARADLPRRFHDLVARRVAGLPEEDRALLDVAAVDGLEFDGEALAAVLERPLLGVLRSLQRLTRERGLIVPRAQGYRFSNPILREVLYAELAPALRGVIHARLAEHLEGRGEPGADSERVGRHWERAGAAERAAPHLRSAALEASRRQELRRAIDLASRAGFVPGATETRTALANPEVLFEVAATYSTFGRHEEAELLLRKLLDAAAEKGDEVLRLRTAVRYNRSRYFVKGVAAVDEGELRRAAGTLPKCAELGRALYLLGIIARLRNDLGEASVLLRRADEVFLELGDGGMHSGTLDQIASLHMRQGSLREAEALYAESARVAATAGRRTNACISDVNRILAAFSRGAIEESIPDLERAVRILALEGANFSAAHATVVLAQLRYAAGDLAGAEAALQEAVGILRSTSYLPGLANALFEIAHLAAVRGRLDEARGALDEAALVASKGGDRDSIAICSALRAWSRAALGDRAGAEVEARAALAAGETGREARATILLFLAEACLYSLPPGVLAGADGLLAGPGEHSEALRRIVASAIDGVRAAADPRGDPKGLRLAAAALRAPEVGQRRSALRIVADLLEAEADRRDGGAGAAEEAASRAREAAGKLGHVWLEASALALLERIDPAAGYATPLARLRERVAMDLSSPEERALVSRASFFPPAA